MFLTALTLLFLWMLQISFIEPYYERSRVQVIEQKIIEVEKAIQKDKKAFSSESLTTILIKDNICGSIYDAHGDVLITTKSNMVCMIPHMPKPTTKEYIRQTQKSANRNYNLKFSSDLFEQGLYFHVQELQVEQEYFYLFLNAPLELLDSTVYVLRRQFALLAIIVFSLGTIISFLLSHHLSKPIQNMTRSARRLGDGDLEVSFVGEGYAEMQTLAKTLNYATEEFKKTDDLRRDLVANVSHDYKTPLTMIRAYAEMIKDISGDDKAKREEHLDIILSEVAHLELLVNDMLVLSQYESKMYQFNAERFHLRTHVENALKLFDFSSWTVNLEISDDIYVYADEIKMGQVLHNYLTNALKYANQEKRLDILASIHENNDVYVFVRDYGAGIPKSIQNEIWDRYFKVDKNYARNQSHSGLGLSIVRAICEAADSDYGVFSNEDKGVSFYYSLKLAKDEPQI